MTEQRERAFVRQAIDNALSNVKPDPGLADRVMRGEEKMDKEKKKMRLGLALLMAALLLSAAAVAVVREFGVLDYLPQQTGNKTYVESILTLEQKWEGEYFSATIHEAVFDGMKCTFTMSISPKEGADPVYVIPRIYATVNGQKHSTRVMSGRGGFEVDGFWVPAIMPDFQYDYSEWAVDVALSRDGWRYAPTAELIEWQVDFDVLHTDWPIRFTEEDEPAMDEAEWTEEQWMAYERQFLDAYANKQVLLNRAGMFGFWLAAVAQQQEGETFADYCQAAMTTEAFTLVERASFRFHTPGQPVRTMKTPVCFTTGEGFRVELTELNVSVSQIEMMLRITSVSGVSLLCDDWKTDFVLIAENAKTEMIASSLGMMEDGSLQYTAQIMIDGPTNRLFLLPVSSQTPMVTVDTPEGPIVCSQHKALMQQLTPMTPEQEKLAVEIELE